MVAGRIVLVLTALRRTRLGRRRANFFLVVVCFSITLHGCATDPLAERATENACDTNERAQLLLGSRKEIRNELLDEVAQHRYESCGAGSECERHIVELAARMDATDAQLADACSGFSKWQQGFEGLVDPTLEADGTAAQYRGDPQRSALHDRLVGDALSAAPADDESLQAIMTMGAPGSGKSYVLGHLGLCEDSVVLVDPDAFKQSLVEYRAAIAADDLLAADRVHRESSRLAKRTRDEAIESRRDLCIDGVLSKREAAIDLIARLQNAGYELTIVAVTVPFDVAYERVLRRGEETGRFVPLEFARQAHAKIETHRDEILRLADHGFLFDTNQPYGTPPALVAQYENGEQVYPSSRYP